MATSRLTFGAVLETVTTTATALTGALSAVSEGTQILGAFVSKAAEEQRYRHLADKESFIERLITEKSEERATANLAVERFIAKSASHAKHYEDAYNTFTAILRPSAD